MTNTLAVVGAGVIGLSAAWRAAAKGHAVTVHDPEPVRGGASWLAGGMLAPVTEAWPGEEDVLALGEESLRRWPGFAADLVQEGVDPGLAGHGTLVVAFDSADAGHLDILADHLQSLGRAAERLTGREAKRLEPGVGSVRSGLHVPGDLAVDNRKLLNALYAVCVNRQVRFVRERVETIPDADAVVLAGRRLDRPAAPAAGRRRPPAQGRDPPAETAPRLPAAADADRPRRRRRPADLPRPARRPGARPRRDAVRSGLRPGRHRARCPRADRGRRARLPGDHRVRAGRDGRGPARSAAATRCRTSASWPTASTPRPGTTATACCWPP